MGVGQHSPCWAPSCQLLQSSDSCCLCPWCLLLPSGIFVHKIQLGIASYWLQTAIQVCKCKTWPWNATIPEFHHRDNNIMNAFCQQGRAIYVRNNINRKKRHWECHKGLLWYRTAENTLRPWILSLPLHPTADSFSSEQSSAQNRNNSIIHVLHHIYCSSGCVTSFTSIPITEIIQFKQFSLCLGPFHCFRQFLN